MTAVIVLLMLAFLVGTFLRLRWIRDLGPEPAFRTEDDPRWTEMRYGGLLD